MRMTTILQLFASAVVLWLTVLMVRVNRALLRHHREWVVYAGSLVLQIPRHSRNDSAYFDELGTADGSVSDSGIEWSKLAFWAMRADVLEELSDLDSWFVCSECGDDCAPSELAQTTGDDLPMCDQCREIADGTEPAEDSARYNVSVWIEGATRPVSSEDFTDEVSANGRADVLRKGITAAGTTHRVSVTRVIVQAD
jgi:hypothetical protein